MSRRMNAVVLLLLVAIWFVPSHADAAAAGDVIASFPVPAQAPGELTWDGQSLWLVDRADNRLLEIDPADGRLLSERAIGVERPVAVAWDGTDLWLSDEAAAGLTRIGRDDVPLAAPATETRRGVSPLGGLTWDGSHLWSAYLAGWGSRVVRVNPDTGAQERKIIVKGRPVALACDGAHLWSATDNGGHRSGIIYRYGVESGLYESQFDAPGLYPVGLACDGEHLWCVDGETLTIHKLAIEEG